MEKIFECFDDYQIKMTGYQLPTSKTEQISTVFVVTVSLTRSEYAVIQPLRCGFMI